MNSQAFRVLAISSDRRLLRDLSRFLNVFGYQLHQVADAEQLETTLAADRHQFLLIDSDGSIDAAQITRDIMSRESRSPNYIMHLVADPTPATLTEALESGADDFLAKPLIYGELLARIRNGARVLEYERRVNKQVVFDALTGFVSRTGFHDRLRYELDLPTRHRSQWSCVAFDIDFLDQVNVLRGWTSGDALIRTTANEISQAIPDGGIVSSFGSGRFVVLLPGFSTQQAQQWAEELRQHVETSPLEIDQQEIHRSISAGVIAINKSSAEEDTPEDLIDQLLGVLKTAKQSGRNFVAVEGEFDVEEQDWAKLATSGEVFITTVARDVMTPCAVILDVETNIGTASKVLTQTQLPELPVVDQEGNLLGIIQQEVLNDESTATRDLTQSITEFMSDDVANFPEDTEFDELMEFFAEDPASLVVIVRGNHPLGIVRREYLAALSEPVRPDTFLTTGGFSTSSDYLVVAKA